MKTSLLLILSFLVIFSIATNFSSAAEAPEPVLDVAGKMLRTGINYYILPANVVRGRVRYGGLTLCSIGNDSCPVGVFQETSAQNNGIPVTFFPVNPKKGVVRVSTDLNIKFAYPETCGQSPVWSVDNTVDPFSYGSVNIGGVIGNPGPETLSSWFKIQKVGYRVYKLVFCPTVCSDCDVICTDLGIMYQDGGKRGLSLPPTDIPYDPLTVVFKQA